jgi:hypothetical protein
MDEVYGIVASGELQGSATYLQLPDVPCHMAYISACADNAGNVYLGTSASVTVANGTTDVTTGLRLGAGDMVVLPITNLNLLFRICDNAGDDLTYLATR